MGRGQDVLIKPASAAAHQDANRDDEDSEEDQNVKSWT